MYNKLHLVKNKIYVCIQLHVLKVDFVELFLNLTTKSIRSTFCNIRLLLYSFCKISIINDLRIHVDF